MIDQINNTLLKNCLENDRAAQKLLYQRSKDYLMSIAYRYAKDINMAKDILQNAYMKIFLNLSDFNFQKGSFKSWAGKIVINEALQMKRKTRELEMPENIETVEEYTVIPSLDKFTLEELSEFINTLPEVHRVILNLFYFDQFSHEEIAKILNIKRSSSRAQLSKARKLLLERWKQFNSAAI